MDPRELFIVVLFSMAMFCQATENNSCTSCNASHTPEGLRLLRLEQLKQNIFAQLGYTEPPEAPADAGPPPEIDTDILDDYEELTSAAADSETKCISGDFFAKPINSFVGVLSPVEGKHCLLHNCSILQQCKLWLCKGAVSD